MFRITVQDRRGPRTFTFAQDLVTIGRAAERDLVLEVDEVAPLHAEVRFDRARGVVVVDDRSGRGSRRARRRLERSSIVGPDDWLSFGPVEVRIRHDDFAREPESADERAFLAALDEDPRDDATRAVYADWLEEQGRPAHAEFLRAQVAARGGAEDEEAFAAASARLALLASSVEVAWRARVAMARVQACGEQAVGRPGYVAFELECHRRWHEMIPTAVAGIRRCTACRKDVAYCTTMDQALGWAEEGGCVAVDVALAPASDGDREPRYLVRGRPAPNVASRGNKRV